MLGLSVLIETDREEFINDSEVKLLIDVLNQNGLSLPDPIEDNSIEDYAVRAYAFRSIADYCRAENLSYRHLKSVTCSQWEFIVPIDFAEPIPVFTTKQPHDYKGLCIPLGYGTKEKCDTGHRYPYYMNTQVSDIYLLSAHRLLGELEDFLDNEAPEWRKEGLYWGNQYLGEDELAHDALYFAMCCLCCVKWNAFIQYSG